MPTYDYECDACGHKFEVFQNMSDELLRKCPQCKKQKLRRLFGTGAAIMFKGSGFYTTDYRSDSYKKRADADKPSSGSSEKSDSKGDSSKGDSSSKSEKTAESKSESPKTETKSESR